MKAKEVFEAVSSYFNHNLIKWENLVGVYIDSALEMLQSQSEFCQDKPQKSKCSRNLLHYLARGSCFKNFTCYNDQLTTATCVVNFVKKSSIKSKLFATTCKDMDAAHVVSHDCLMAIKRQYAC